MEEIPIVFHEHFQLTSLGINSASLGFSSVTMESDRFICVRDKDGEMNQVVIINMNDIANPIKKPISADSAIMNPVCHVIALKGKTGNEPPNHTTLQIFNIEMKTNLKSHVMLDEVEFWKWISQSKLAIVTHHCVYHWEINGDSLPIKMFDRHSSLKGYQIFQYKTDPKQNWLLLLGITSQENQVVGGMQLYSVEQKSYQIIQGHAATFVQLKIDKNPDASNLLSFTMGSTHSSNGKLYVAELGQSYPGNVPFSKRFVDIKFSVEVENDFPVAMQASSKYSIIFLITKHSFVYLFDVETVSCIYMSRICSETIFVTSPHESTGGIIGVNRKGQVLSISVNESSIISYIDKVLNLPDLAIRIATQNNLCGAEDLFKNKFTALVQKGLLEEAAILAATAPNDILRTPQTIHLFQNLSSEQGRQPPLLRYFSILLDRYQLNKYESLELSRPVMAQGKKHLVEKWLRENKLDCSEELGDLLRQYDPVLALSVFLRADIHPKVVLCMAETGQFSKISLYAERVGYSPDYSFLLKNCAITNPEQLLDFTKVLVKNNQNISFINEIADIFIGQNMVKECTAFLLENMKNDPCESQLQTKLLEINLKTAPQVADAILGNNMFTYFDKPQIAHLCASVGLLQHALKNYTDLYDIKKTVTLTHLLDPCWLIDFFGSLTCNDSLECLKALLASNIKLNLNLCIRIAVKYHQQLDVLVLINLFESFHSYEGLFYFLGAVVNFSENPEVHYKYIKAACETSQVKEVERVCRESKFYDPEKVKILLKELKLEDQMPLIIVSDRFNYVEELVHYLHQNNLYNFIEIFVKKVNPSRLPVVVGILIGIDYSQEQIKNLISAVQGGFSLDSLIEVLERHNNLKLLLPWLENQISNGETVPAVHNALAKLHIDSGNSPDRFLMENKYYDSRVVGKYCEKSNPQLACLVYERGLCDQELIDICQRNSLFKAEARYLIQRRDADLWAVVLTSDNPCRKQLIDQVVQNLLNDAQDAENIAVTLKAFMVADLPFELIDLLERLTEDNSVFSSNRNLQNLLVSTAIKTDRSKVMKFISKFNNYDAQEIGNIAVKNELYEEAIVIFKKCKEHSAAIKVLIENIGNLVRASDFAECCDEPAVWSQLAMAQLSNGFIKEAIDSFTKAEDSSYYLDVVQKAHKAELWDDLVKFLHMVRETKKNPFIDSELLFALAKTNSLEKLECFVSKPHTADILEVGDKCFKDGMYEAAKLLFGIIPNYARLATVFVVLKEFPQAVDSATKSHDVQTLKNVCFACVEHEEFHLAQMCGVFVVVFPDNLEEVVVYYIENGYFKHLISLLEAALSMERVHMGIFTELAILYSEYEPAKMKEHLDLFWSRINVPRVISAAAKVHMWADVVFLHDKYEDYDSAVSVMIDHPTETWKERYFTEALAKVVNCELHFQAIKFYLEFKPLLLNDLLLALIPRLNHSRAVDFFIINGHLKLVKPYLCKAQYLNNKAINEALNSLYIEEHDFRNLQTSIETFSNYDSSLLAEELETLELVEFQRIAAGMYKANKKWKHSVMLCQKSKLYKEAITYAADSKNPEIVEGLLEWFLAEHNYDCFASSLFVCYDLIRPDIIIEMAWKNGVVDFVMPYFIQVMQEYTMKVDGLVESERRRLAMADAENNGLPPPDHQFMITPTLQIMQNETPGSSRKC